MTDPKNVTAEELFDWLEGQGCSFPHSDTKTIVLKIREALTFAAQEAIAKECIRGREFIEKAYQEGWNRAEQEISRMKDEVKDLRASVLRHEGCGVRHVAELKELKGELETERRNLDRYKDGLNNVTQDRDRLKAEVDQQKLANKINSDEWRQDRDRYKALSKKYKEALEKISKDTIRVEYRGEDLARYETSETAKVAKEAIALFDAKGDTK